MRIFGKAFCGLICGLMLLASGHERADARDRGVGTAVGVGVGVGIGLHMLNEAAKAMNKDGGGGPKGQPGRSGSGGGGRTVVPQQSGPEKAQAAQNLRNSAELANELLQIELANRMESDRNVDSAVNAFIDDLKSRHKRLLGERANVSVASNLNINEVTAGQIKAAAEEAYRGAQLAEFERLSGEIWTRDRLMVFLLRHSRRSVAPYYHGAGSKGPSMADLKDVFNKSARDVYSRALETAELIGVSHSFDRFIRTIYENSDRADESLWTTGADGRYERLMSSVVDAFPREAFAPREQSQLSDSLGVERQFQFRFRARRALYDCLSASYSSLLGGATSEVAQGGAETSTSAKLESGSTGSATAMVVVSNLVWRRAEVYVGDVCRTGLQSVLKAASGGGIRPQAARFNNALPADRADTDLQLVVPMRLPGAQ